MERPNRDVQHEWHVAINQYHYGENFKKINEHQRFMYDAKNIADEIPRMSMLFKAEREGTLTKIHQQCSHSEPEQVIDNHLSCCLGVKCKECPFLLALEGTNVSRENAAEQSMHLTAGTLPVQLDLFPPEMFTVSEGYPQPPPLPVKPTVGLTLHSLLRRGSVSPMGRA